MVYLVGAFVRFCGPLITADDGHAQQRHQRVPDCTATTAATAATAAASAAEQVADGAHGRAVQGADRDRRGQAQDCGST